jgi:hypothetical protein
MGLKQRFDRIDGIRPAPSHDFQVRRFEAGIAREGQTYHFHPVRGRRHVLFVFVGRYRRRDEQYPVKLQTVPDLFCGGKMAVMDGVERPAEDADS